MQQGSICPLVFSRNELFLLVYHPILAKLSKILYGLFNILLAHEHVSILIENSKVNLSGLLLNPHLFILNFFNLLQIDKFHIFVLLNIWLHMKPFDC